MFATNGNLSQLNRADIWYGDGPFSFCPNIFYQLYTIHAEVHGQIVPLVYILLPSKSKQCYKLMLSLLKNLMVEKVINSNLKAFRSYLELGLIKTLLSIFTPGCVSNCFFHLAQAHWRKIQNLGLVEFILVMRNTTCCLDVSLHWHLYLKQGWLSTSTLYHNLFMKMLYLQYFILYNTYQILV